VHCIFIFKSLLGQQPLYSGHFPIAKTVGF
jgi:hypothetical protein